MIICSLTCVFMFCFVFFSVAITLEIILKCRCLIELTLNCVLQLIHLSLAEPSRTGILLPFSVLSNTDCHNRSHTFAIRSRPENIDPSARIFNLNVRGKRGNIVQTYPGVEYDFVPNRLTLSQGDYVHIQ